MKSECVVLNAVLLYDLHTLSEIGSTTCTPVVLQKFYKCSIKVL